MRRKRRISAGQTGLAIACDGSRIGLDPTVEGQQRGAAMASEAAFDPIFEENLIEHRPTRGPVFGEFLHASSGRRLLVMVEPIATTFRARENAAKIVEVAGSRFRAQPLMALRDIVVDCCDNAMCAGDRPTWPKLRTVGVTAAIIDGQRAVVARTSPGAILLVQDGKLEVDPPFTEVPIPPIADGDGRSLLNINFQQGDVLMICSTALLRSLKKAAVAREEGVDTLAQGLCGKVDELIAGFEDLAAADDLDATAGAMLFRSSLSQALIWQPIGIEPASDTLPAPLDLVREKPAPAIPLKIVSIYAERPPRARATEIETSPLALNNASNSTLLVKSKHERIHTYLLHAFEAHFPKHRSNAFTFGSGAPTAIMPGASTVQLFRGAYGEATMTGIRTHLPRGPRVHVPTKLISMVLTVLIVLASLAFFYDRSQGRAEAAKEAITAADVQLASAENESNPVTLAAELALAEKALATAEANGASDKQLEPRRQALANVKDRMANIVRLTNITRVGMVPPEVAVLKPKLIQHGDDTYLVGGGLYHLDPTTRTLNLVLRQDKKIAGGEVGTLFAGAVDRNGITLADGKYIYRTGTTGKWKRLEIGTLEGNLWDVAICGTLDGSFYILNASTAQILKFEADQLDVVQNPWTTDPELEHAKDMVVTSNIYVLLADGRIMSFKVGRADATLSVSVTPAISAPTTMFGGQDVNFMYVADKGNGNGRISRIDFSGELSRQYLLPEKGREGYAPGAEHAFSQIDDLVVNEANGQIVILSGDQIWSATIPSAEAQTA